MTKVSVVSLQLPKSSVKSLWNQYCREGLYCVLMFSIGAHFEMSSANEHFMICKHTPQKNHRACKAINVYKHYIAAKQKHDICWTHSLSLSHHTQMHLPTHSLTISLSLWLICTTQPHMHKAHTFLTPPAAFRDSLRRFWFFQFGLHFLATIERKNFSPAKHCNVQ